MSQYNQSDPGKKGMGHGSQGRKEYNRDKLAPKFGEPGFDIRYWEAVATHLCSS